MQATWLQNNLADQNMTNAGVLLKIAYIPPEETWNRAKMIYFPNIFYKKSNNWYHGNHIRKQSGVSPACLFFSSSRRMVESTISVNLRNIKFSFCFTHSGVRLSKSCTPKDTCWTSKLSNSCKSPLAATLKSFLRSTSLSLFTTDDGKLFAVSHAPNILFVLPEFSPTWNKIEVISLHWSISRPMVDGKSAHDRLIVGQWSADTQLIVGDVSINISPFENLTVSKDFPPTN